MSRYDILCGRPVPVRVIPEKAIDYFYGIDVGVLEGTAVAVCHVDDGRVVYDYVEKKLCNINDWLLSLNQTYHITCGLGDTYYGIYLTALLDSRLASKIKFMDNTRPNDMAMEMEYRKFFPSTQHVGFSDGNNNPAGDESIHDAMVRACFIATRKNG